ncbi:MAG: DNA-protecting protein DprA [Cyanobacteria bacterium MAG CAR4_bin_6]|nr:DNA-protecting protein DprA [Cyanobacteria bacterium MAG CAR4_bin_6]
MNLRSRRLAWYRWASIDGFGVATLRRLEAVFGSLEAAWRTPLAVLQQRGRLNKTQVQALTAALATPPPLPPRRWLAPTDPAFPAPLQQLDRPPLQLFWQGKGSTWAYLNRRQAVAVVGSRTASDHALAWAERLGRHLAEVGWPVVSGLAAGVDAAVHRGCLAGHGRPVGVLGTHLQRAYPQDNRSLQQQVGTAGLLFSEQPPGEPVRRGHFAARNRLLVSLVQALVVVECPRRSGALIAARLARETGAPLWVVPADAGRSSAEGSNQLLQQGAAVLLHGDDLSSVLGTGPLLARQKDPVTDRQAVPTSGMARLLLEQLGQPRTLEELQEQVGSAEDQGLLLTQLFQLQLDGAVRSLPGLRWVRIR